MYGYSYGTAAADVWHKVIQSAHMYPGYFTTGEARPLSGQIGVVAGPSSKKVIQSD